MPKPEQAGHLDIPATRELVRTNLAVVYAELGLPEIVVSALSGGGRLNRGVIIYSIASGYGSRAQVAFLATTAELIHRASVIVDDIQDGDTVRRGRPSFHILVGTGRALAVADLLLSTGLSRLAAMGGQYLNEAIGIYEDMAKGQALDVGVLPSEGLDIDYPARLKTGTLIRMCFRLGARLSELPEGTVDIYSQIGMHLGCAFQLQNDLDNVLGKDPRTSRPGSDLARGNVSSVLLALRRGAKDLSEAATMVAARREEHFDKVQQILAESGISVPGPLSLVIRDFALAFGFVGDQVRSSSNSSEF
ncbi:polyprenyl synthetase family protein [Micromonospora chalcea]